MRTRISLTLSAALALCGAAAPAQWPAPSGLSPEMKKLDFLVGKWKSVTKISPSGGAPIERQETIETTWGLGGQYLLVRGTETWPGQPPVEDLVLLAYDPLTRQYRVWASARWVHRDK